MGLNISCNGVDMSMGYGAFSVFRTLIWRHISGLELGKMEGFENRITGDEIPFPNKYKLEYFINHSDYGGEISSDQALTMLPELKKVCDDAIELSKDPENNLGKRVAQLRYLYEIFEQSAVSNKPVEFG
jgi:hypothetical protein